MHVGATLRWPLRIAQLFGAFSRNVRRRPTLPQPLGCSTIGAERLNFRVRDGTGCFPFAMAAVTLVASCPGCGHRAWPSLFSIHLFVPRDGAPVVCVFGSGREAHTLCVWSL